jgi:myo-inositol-1(or 4)-monophosphatase
VATAVLTQVGVVRNLCPTSLQLAYVACGRLDAFWEFGEDTFNCLAGVLLIEEAGGVVTDVDGHDYRMQATSLIAGSQTVHTISDRKVDRYLDSAIRT